MIAKDVKLIEYSKSVDIGNCLTHAFGAVLSVAALFLLTADAEGARKTVSVLLYGISMLAVYTISSVYHGLKNGEAKRIARLLDHAAIPLLIAGTTTPYALVILYDISITHGIAVLSAAWFCALFGMFSKLVFFEKLKKVTYAVYIICIAAMFLSVIPLAGKTNAVLLALVGAGNVTYLIGAVFCYLGVRQEKYHVVFHLITLVASAIHFYVIYFMVIR